MVLRRTNEGGYTRTVWRWRKETALVRKETIRAGQACTAIL